MNPLNHVAIIMDGNGRWGISKRGSRHFGHLQGIKSVEKVIKFSLYKKIPYLTLYTFSTENWRRPEKEINFLFELIRKYTKKNLSRINKQGVKIRIIGQRKNLPSDIIKTIRVIEKKTANNNKLFINLALNYGSKEEILSACKKFISEKKKNINIKQFQEKLFTKDIPDPDFLIRTGGKKRLSNFLLWQMAYTEIYFVNKMWPDFNEKDYNKAINKFKREKRNFGAI